MTVNEMDDLEFFYNTGVDLGGVML